MLRCNRKRVNTSDEIMIPNLRDVGETVNILSGDEIMLEKVLYRGGAVNQLFDKSELPLVNSILNLRTGKDQSFSLVRDIHIPAIDTVENYETSNAKVKTWANRALQAIHAVEVYPLLVHCTAGKDRTGVIVALILSCIGIDREIILEEYLQSKGVHASTNIKIALEGFGRLSDYIYDQSIIDFFKRQLTIKVM